ncbi:hypothetical protein B0H17DRAFT_420503 [Mycena rosella]|uniref:Uncharacterized protein n=1 Tax=Mycena rosella TaxID=1033263 RepID=A0AAD7CHI6_MYCRO|nr:hypothetical protein B0H17DRAFT_420503 [Mycena rosella]
MVFTSHIDQLSTLVYCHFSDSIVHRVPLGIRMGTLPVCALHGGHFYIHDQDLREPAVIVRVPVAPPYSPDTVNHDIEMTSIDIPSSMPEFQLSCLSIGLPSCSRRTTGYSISQDAPRIPRATGLPRACPASIFGPPRIAGPTSTSGNSPSTSTTPRLGARCRRVWAVRHDHRRRAARERHEAQNWSGARPLRSASRAAHIFPRPRHSVRRHQLLHGCPCLGRCARSCVCHSHRRRGHGCLVCAVVCYLSAHACASGSKSKQNNRVDDRIELERKNGSTSASSRSSTFAAQRRITVPNRDRASPDAGNIAVSIAQTRLWETCPWPTASSAVGGTPEPQTAASRTIFEGTIAYLSPYSLQFSLYR